jgi:metal-sulfur cluster biosynthetic enzyme
MTSSPELIKALAAVLDPELDMSIVELGFVTGCWLDDERTAHIRLRLPTYFCAPNFAYLMVADAHDAVARLDDVEAVDIALEDHFAAGEINGGIAARNGFVAAFDGLAECELDDLRRTFVRKAALAAQDRVVRPLLATGTPHSALAGLTLADLPPSPDRDRLRSRRAELGLAAGDDAPVLLQLDGSAVPDADVPVHLRRTRTVRMSMDVNVDVCRQLLAERHRTQAHRDETRTASSTM